MGIVVSLLDRARFDAMRNHGESDSWHPLPCSVTPWRDFAARHYDRAFQDGLHAVPPLVFADKIFPARPAC